MKSHSNHANVSAVQPLTTFKKENRMQKQSTFTLKLAACVAMFIVMAMSALPSFAQANPNWNPNQIAILRWYHANTTPSTLSISGVSGTSPIAYDGENMWVGDVGCHLTQFSTDGKVLYGPVLLSGCSYLVGMAFDGQNIWVTDFYGNAVFKFNVNTHTSTRYAVGANPYFIAFDGANMWVAQNGASNVAAYKASSGALVATYTVGSSPTGVAFDGKCIWVANTGNSSTGSVTIVNPPGGSCTLTGTHVLSSPYNIIQPFGLAWDGQNMWVSYRGANGSGPGGVVALSGTTAAEISGSEIQCSTGGVGTLTFDGAYIWLAGSSSGQVCKSTSTRFTPPYLLVGKYASSGAPNQIAFDGTNIWTSLGNTSVEKY